MTFCQNENQVKNQIEMAIKQMEHKQIQVTSEWITLLEKGKTLESSKVNLLNNKHEHELDLHLPFSEVLAFFCDNLVKRRGQTIEGEENDGKPQKTLKTSFFTQDIPPDSDLIPAESTNSTINTSAFSQTFMKGDKTEDEDTKSQKKSFDSPEYDFTPDEDTSSMIHSNEFSQALIKESADGEGEEEKDKIQEIVFFKKEIP